MGKDQENIAELRVDMRYVKNSVDGLKETMSDHIAVSNSKSDDHHERIRAMEDVLKFLKLFAKWVFVPLALLWPAFMPLLQHYVLELFNFEEVDAISLFLLPFNV